MSLIIKYGEHEGVTHHFTSNTTSDCVDTTLLAPSQWTSTTIGPPVDLKSPHPFCSFDSATWSQIIVGGVYRCKAELRSLDVCSADCDFVLSIGQVFVLFLTIIGVGLTMISFNTVI